MCRAAASPLRHQFVVARRYAGYSTFGSQVAADILESCAAVAPRTTRLLVRSQAWSQPVQRPDDRFACVADPSDSYIVAVARMMIAVVVTLCYPLQARS
jgi:hypothetical protein